MTARVVVVTGGARGIGLAIATALAAAGDRVVIGDLDRSLVTARARQIGGWGFSLDVRDDASYTRFLARVIAEVGPVDALIHNAGVALPGDFVGSDVAGQDLQIDVNIRGVLRGSRLVLPLMLARGQGRVVTVASAAGVIPAPGAAVYSATKHAVVAFHHAVRAELRGTGVALTAVLPTAVSTEMSAGLRMRGLPTVTPDVVARAVVRVLARRRPPSTVMVPWWLRPVAMADAVSPQWLRDLARRVASVDPVTDSVAWESYQRRVVRQLRTRDLGSSQRSRGALTTPPGPPGEGTPDGR